MMQHILAVAVGGGIGAVGSFLIGLLMMYFQAQADLPPSVKLFAVTGVLGGFTTFSTFNMELLTFIRAGEMGFALLYGGLNVVGAFLFCWLGLAAGTALW